MATDLKEQSWGMPNLWRPPLIIKAFWKSSKSAYEDTSQIAI